MTEPRWERLFSCDYHVLHWYKGPPFANTSSSVLDMCSPANTPRIEVEVHGYKRSSCASSLYLQLKIFLSVKSLLSCTVFVTSSSPSCPLSVILHHPSRLQDKLIYHRPKEGLHFVCCRGSPSISCSPNERGCCVPTGPQGVEGARSPVPGPTWGSNYPSGGPLRGALPAGRSNSHTVDFHI